MTAAEIARLGEPPQIDPPHQRILDLRGVVLHGLEVERYRLADAVECLPLRIPSLMQPGSAGTYTVNPPPSLGSSTTLNRM